MGQISNPSGEDTATDIPGNVPLPALVSQDPVTLPVTPLAGFSGSLGIATYGNIVESVGNFSQSAGTSAVASPSHTSNHNGLYDKRAFRRFSTSAALNVQSNTSEGGISQGRCARISGSPFLPWRAVTRLSFSEVFKLSGRFFCGFCPSGAAFNITGVFNDLVNVFGFGKDDNDTELYLISNDGAGVITKTSIGLQYTDVIRQTFSVYHGFDGLTCNLLVTNIITGTEYSGSESVNIPDTDQGIQWVASVGSGAVDATLNRFYISQVAIYDPYF